jgi:hypothetical protein
MLTSDPHACLRPIFARLQTQAGFAHLSPSHQFLQLLDALVPDHPVEAMEMRGWSPGAQDALVQHLASMNLQTPPAVVSQLWTVTKDNRSLRCIVHYLSSGLDLRLLEGDGFRRTQLCKTAPEANELAEGWKKALVERGWE